MYHHIDIRVGDRFGRLVVLDEQGRNARRYILYRCRCDCGAEKTVAGVYLAQGETKSCGCLVPDASRAHATKHGDNVPGHRAGEYSAWSAAIHRCTNPNNMHWKDYGGRGITVCDRWRNSYPAFLADMGRKPSPRHSIDRIDVNGNYEPGNCRWATPQEQARNHRPKKIGLSAREQIREFVSIGWPRTMVARIYGVSRTMVDNLANVGAAA